MSLDWTSEEVEILLSPRLGRRLEIENKLRATEGFGGHIWLATSGSRRQKYAALSKAALLASARAVNKHLESHSKDVWFNALPVFHVGGLSIWARAHLSNASVAIYPDVTKQKWDVVRFYQALTQAKATLTSLVPAQVFDVVTADLKAPLTLRAVLVGGGHISETLYTRATALGWPLIPTYGFTECCSQVATAKTGERKLKLLDHIEANVDSSGNLMLKSSALFTAYAYELEERMMIDDPKRQGWYHTHDIVSIKDNTIEVLGRSDDLIKVGGESVLLTLLERKLQELMLQASLKDGLMLIAGKDERLGTIINAMAEKQLDQALIEKIVDTYNNQVLPFERIRTIQWVDSIPRTILGKMIKRAH